MFSEYKDLSIEEIVERELIKNHYLKEDFTEHELDLLGKEIDVWRTADEAMNGNLAELEITSFRKMILKIVLDRAIDIAMVAHKGQVDKGGHPYIEHPIRVMKMGETMEEKIAGVLHDVLEDSPFPLDYLAVNGVPPEVLEALICLTKQSKDEDYDHFIERVKTNPLAVRVKLNDLMDNMNITRLNEITEDDIPRLNKYIRAYKQLIELV